MIGEQIAAAFDAQGADVDWKSLIEARPDVMQGKSCIRGTRISVELILERFSAGWDMATLIDAYPHLSAEDIQAALAFAAELLPGEGKQGSRLTCGHPDF